MTREVALKIVLALTYPLILFARQDPALSMMFSIYVTLGVFLLLAIRNPLANRSLIAFTAWSSFAHAAVMGTQAFRNMISGARLRGSSALPTACDLNHSITLNSSVRLRWDDSRMPEESRIHRNT